jgi:hypothetical protein
VLTADVGERHPGERLLQEMRSLEGEPRVVVGNQPSIRVSPTELRELVLNVLTVSVWQ